MQTSQLPKAAVFLVLYRTGANTQRRGHLGGKASSKAVHHGPFRLDLLLPDVVEFVLTMLADVCHAGPHKRRV